MTQPPQIPTELSRKGKLQKKKIKQLTLLQVTLPFVVKLAYRHASWATCVRKQLARWQSTTMRGKVRKSTIPERSQKRGCTKTITDINCLRVGRQQRMDSSPKDTLENKSAAESHQRTPANLEALLLLYVYTDSGMKRETSKETSDIDQRWRKGGGG